MSRIYITGVSGTGKTALASKLSSLGLPSISIDEVPGLCFWRDRNTGTKIEHEAVLDEKFVSTHDWVCDVKRLQELMADKEGNVVALGIAANQEDFLGLFDKILLLQCKPETFTGRIMQRQDNDFGKDPGTQEWMLSWYKGFEDKMIKMGSITIDAEQPLEQVARLVMEEIKGR